eukprot:TRINITY_DN18150_c0_g1_i2.p1 TRINITY_DN18150_c0_g1~~TRINITY_DN18150_c0_g1_i2.p1  ORF type:complete len:924 (+),score=148.77 TRINITY_DN18150_c0_g1_i2:59-2773(+)
MSVVPYVSLVALCTLQVSATRGQGFVGSHVRHEAENDAWRRGCTSKTSCSECLMHHPFLTGGNFCRWCPQQFWYGPSHALVTADRAGVCRAQESVNEVCGGGLKWINVRDSTNTSQQGTGRRALDAEEAKNFCPAPEEESFRLHSQLKYLRGEDLKDPVLLDTTLALLNLDLQRMKRFRITNPSLFNRSFDARGGWASEIGSYAWKTTLLGANFIPVAGGMISFGLGLATSGAQATAEEVNSMLEAQKNSQANLCSKGRKAKLEYFTDVTYGMLHEHYQEVQRLSQDALDQKRNDTLKTGLVGSGGQAINQVSDTLSGNRARAASAVVHTGLFVGGFFNFGITWVVGTSLGAVELAAEISAHYGKAKSLSQKMFLLTGLARQMDLGAWSTDLVRCYITDVDDGRDPCPPIELPDNSGSLQRVCSRSSPWNHHLEKIPEGELSSEGRCVPRPRTGLENGLPCVAHEGCQSSYCHFEPRLQYFFSDHPRKQCDGKVGERRCRNIFDELLAFQVAEVPLPNRTGNEKLWNVRPGDFTASYQGSYKGPLYATTGTCATACKKESVGQGSCAELSIGGTKADKRVSLLGRFQFGVRQRNRIFAGDGDGYARIGDGMCAVFLDSQDVLEDEAFHNHPLAIEATVQAEGVASVALQDCAHRCKTKNQQEFDCRAFTFEHLTGRCHLHASAANSVHASLQSIHPSTQMATCYSAIPSWPLEIYQPWNVEWSTYWMNLERLANILMDTTDEQAELRERALHAVQRAYAGYCGNSEHCLPPEEWQAADAALMIRFDAPLSVDQLRRVREETEPGTTEDVAKPGSTIAVREMFLRPNGFGAAWRNFLGLATVNEVASEVRRSLFGEKVSFSARDKTWVQQLEARAMQYSLRTPDGHWDLGMAEEQLDKEKTLLTK